jgi:hypothetical protein
MSMLLKGHNGNEFELAFSRDSLPDPQDGFGDGRWTTAMFRAATAEESWEETAPAINLYEFTNLAEWLEAVGRGSPEVSEIELLEPELKFTVSQQGDRSVTLRIAFHLQQRPEVFNVDAMTDEAEYIDVQVSRENVLAAGRELRALLVELDRDTGKDDLRGEHDSGAMGLPDEGLNYIDRIEPTPPGAGRGEDNAGNR